jgi:hypothetical protein
MQKALDLTLSTIKIISVPPKKKKKKERNPSTIKM